MRPKLLICTLLLALLSQTLPASGQADQPADKVVLGQISLSFYTVTGAVVRQVLERLGHTVEIVEGSHGQIFPRLGAGEVDLLVAAWLPYGHATYWERYGSQAEAIAFLYEGARFAWMVPSYVPATAVAEIDDLTKPEVLARMDKTIQGTGRDSGNMMVSVEVMQAYGLERDGYRLVPGTLREFYGSYDRAIAARRWFVMPLWFPNFINRVGNMRPIAEPRQLLGPANTGTLVASRTWMQRAPERTLRVLRRMHLGMDGVEEMDYAVNREGKSPDQAARDWVQRNQTEVDGWLAQP
ncbi:MAG TPA: glycine betaine ABC transporter substrate-binding protein [Burkholderiales bacterium]|nr:glycine betaine ABC transporter substrate-binding protein [Burkholderiales bacterium]